MEENQKRTSGGRSENRRSNNSRTRREGNAPVQGAGRGSNAQPKFDPHFVSAPEATPLRPAKKPSAPAAQPAAKTAAPAGSAKGENTQTAPNSQSRRNAQPGSASRPARGGRTERTERPARPAQNAAGSANTGKGRTERSTAGQPARAPRAPKQEASRSRSRNSAPSRDEDPGLVLISRRPPQQKFTNFEEYMNAHGGATAPIEDHSDEV